jgi:TldD protein
VHGGPALDELLEATLGLGAGWAEVFFEDTTSATVRLEDGEVRSASVAARSGVAVRAWRGGPVGTAATSDLSPAGLDRAARLAVAGVDPRSPPPGPWPALAKAGPAMARADAADHRGAAELLMAAADGARSVAAAGSPRVSLTSTTRRIRVLAGPGGLVSAADEQCRTSLRVTCVAAAAGRRERGFGVLASRTGIDAAAAAAHGRAVAAEAVARLPARPAPAGRLAVVFAAGAAGKLFHEVCGHGLEADNVLAEASAYAGRLGQALAPPALHLVDDASLPGAWGSAAIDDEGSPAARISLIEGGRLAGYLWDAHSARRAGHPGAGAGRRQGYRHQPLSRMSNTFVLPGQDDPAEIIAQTGYGILCRRLSGGSVDPATADFVFGMADGALIEGGRVTAPLRGANLVGNGLDVLAAVDAIGADFATGVGTCRKEGQAVPVAEGGPTLRVASLTVGGLSPAS